MTVFQKEKHFKTRGKSFLDVTAEVQACVTESGIEAGNCTVFVRHTSASLVIQENADPRVLADLESWFADLAPESRRWAHDDEGPDDMPAHARAAVTRSSEAIPVVHGRLALGTWQALYLWEHRERPHHRSVLISIVGE